MIKYTPENFFEFLPLTIYDQFRFWHKAKDYIPMNPAALVSASPENGLIVNIGACRPEYRDVYFCAAKFAKNSRRIAEQLAGSISWRASRHEIEYLLIDVTIKNDGLVATYPLEIDHRAEPKYWPENPNYNV